MKTNLLTKVASSVLFAALSITTLPDARAAQIDIVGPVGSGSFGTNVTVLPNGNFVVTDPGYDAPGPIANVGAVYLYDGATLALISTLTGSTANDAVGSTGVTVLSNGNFVVRSSLWNGSRGAVTWGSAITGVTGEVSSANSLVGSVANDSVGSSGVIALSVVALNNGNYVVRSPNWDNGATIDAGAVTWGSGTTGEVGPISSANSLVGTTASDHVGSSGVTLLTNGNYVVSSVGWNVARGAVTWGDGTTGVSGVISSANSLVGSTPDDQVGFVMALNNGNYVVRSTFWNNAGKTYAGAVTWGNGLGGTVGDVSAGNSLVGGTELDFIGRGGVVALSNGNYVVNSRNWHNGSVVDAGAVTWGNGSGGTAGAVSSANSLVGSAANDQVGSFGAVALVNSNYVVISPNWDNGTAVDAGAVTWGNGRSGTVGEVSPANSLVGSSASDAVGNGGVTALNNSNYVVRSSSWNGSRGAVTWGSGLSGVWGSVTPANSLVGTTSNDQIGNGGVIALANGNYVVSSLVWDNGVAINAGAVTWCNGVGGTVGAISAANSLVGSTSGVSIGSTGVKALINGNYVVGSPGWQNGGIDIVGAVTWGSGSGGTVGAVTPANSLVGSSAGDFIGNNSVAVLSNGNYVVVSPSWNQWRGAVTWGDGLGGTFGTVSAANSLVGSTTDDTVGFVTVLNNGNYVVRSTSWDNGAAGDAGAVTWGNGTVGTVGEVSAANSLVGTATSDHIGHPDVIPLNNGNYVVRSTNWDNGTVNSAGAVTLGDGKIGTSGVVGAGTSVFGTVASGGDSMIFTYDLLNDRLLVGYPSANRVSLFTYRPTLDIGMGSTGVRLRFSGAPGRTYNIERAPAITGPWGTNASPIAPISGLIEYIDTSAPPGSAFYRTSTP